MSAAVAASGVGALFDLRGKLALVTGCRRGIGLAIAEILAQAGADIVGASKQLETNGSEAQRRVESAGRSFTAVRADLSERDEVTALARRLGDSDRPLDILVNNAGTILRSPATEQDDTMWDTVLATNLTAPFVLARELGRQMVARGSGKVIFTASLLSFQGGILVPAYTASKHGVAGLVRALSNEWAPRGVQVNGIAPGYIATDNNEALRADPVRSKALLERIPAGRWGTPEDIAAAALYLASPASDYVSGTLLTVDGGWMGR
jgi:2-deoxy-D-gluconate 3-dehydrogenase